MVLGKSKANAKAKAVPAAKAKVTKAKSQTKPANTEKSIWALVLSYRESMCPDFLAVAHLDMEATLTDACKQLYIPLEEELASFGYEGLPGPKSPGNVLKYLNSINDRDRSFLYNVCSEQEKL